MSSAATDRQGAEISTGACYDEEIVGAAEKLKHVDTTFLHCVSIYPTPFDEMHLARMQWIKEVTGSCGFSDHSLVSRDGILGSQAAIAMGRRRIALEEAGLGIELMSTDSAARTYNHLMSDGRSFGAALIAVD